MKWESPCSRCGKLKPSYTQCPDCPPLVDNWSSPETLDNLVSTKSVTPTEGVKHDAGKLRFDLIPPAELEELAKVYTIGAAKYADRNWQKGMKWGRIFAAPMRHTWAWWRGEKEDPEDGISHLIHAARCCFALRYYEKHFPELDDRESYKEGCGDKC